MNKQKFDKLREEYIAFLRQKLMEVSLNIAGALKPYNNETTSEQRGELAWHTVNILTETALIMMHRRLSSQDDLNDADHLFFEREATHLTNEITKVVGSYLSSVQRN